MERILIKRYLPLLIMVLALGYSAQGVWAQESVSVLYVPLIGITSVPSPLTLPEGGGSVTYRYAVKNFLEEVPLTDVRVVDNSCDSVIFVEGDDNGDSRLDYSETWRYSCTANISVTTNSTATATGVANYITAKHQAYAAVVVGSDNPPPLVSIVNITKVSRPLSLSVGGGELTYTYRVTNPGVLPLSDVTVTDDSCNDMSGKLGDINGNLKLDISEAWIYTCTTMIEHTTTSTATVIAYSNGLRAVGYATITVVVAISGFPETGTNSDARTVVWGTLSALLVALFAYDLMMAKRALL